MVKKSVLQLLLRRARTAQFVSREDVCTAILGLVDLNVGYNRYHDALADLSAPLQQLTRRHAACTISVCAELVVEPQNQLDGRRLALLCKFLPEATSSSRTLHVSLGTCWTHVGARLVAGVSRGVWLAHDVHAITSQFLRRGRVHANDAAIEAVEAELYRYLCSNAQRAPDAETLATWTTMSVNLALSGGGGVSRAAALEPLHNALAQRAVDLHTVAPIRPGLLAHLCAQWNRLQLVHAPLAAVVEGEAVSIAEDAELFVVLQSLLFLWRQPAVHAEAALPSLLERLSNEALDAQTWQGVCRTVGDPALIATRMAHMGDEMCDTAIFLCTQLVELFGVDMKAGGLEGCGEDDLQSIASRLLGLRRIFALADPSQAHKTEQVKISQEKNAPGTTIDGTLPAEFVGAVEACARRLGAAAEALMAAESPPFGLMAHLADTPCQAARSCCLELLHEAALQCVHLPTAQAFQFLLVVGDDACRGKDKCPSNDGVLVNYLAEAFVKTATAIPPVQLVTALRAFAVSTPEASSEGGTEGARHALVRFCAEKLHESLSEGTMPLHAVLAATSALHAIGCRDAALYTAVATYISSKSAIAVPNLLCRVAAAAVCEALGEDILDEHPAAHELLLEAADTGMQDDASLTPSVWMHRHDPANTLLPLTAAELHCRQLVDTMAATPAHEHEALTQLAKQYVASLAEAHPDEHRRFFAVCADKVLKEDTVLLACVRALCANPLLLSRLTDTSLASILHSLAAVRFTYTRAVKDLLLCVTREQWQDTSAASLVSILDTMAKLSLAVPALESVLAERLVTLVPLLTPVQTALALRAWQSLGGGSPARRVAVDALLQHAAASARRFDEMALCVFFNTPAVHRLLRDGAIALPLVQQAALQLTSPQQRQKVATSLRRSGLPRELVANATGRLLAPHSSPSLQLER